MGPSDTIKRNAMGGACDMYDGEERCIQAFRGRLERQTSLRRLA
jgi:hypothetical protein